MRLNRDDFIFPPDFENVHLCKVGYIYFILLLKDTVVIKSRLYRILTYGY